MRTYLLKLGELTLKGGNRAHFERVLLGNLSRMVKGTGAQVTAAHGRIYAHCDDDAAAAVENAFDHLAGITGWAEARKTGKTPDEVLAAACEEAERCYKAGAHTFKVESRRTDKSFPLNSYELNCAAGDAIRERLPEFSVDVHKPDALITIEIREKAYIYGHEHKGLRGLPVGTASRGMLLLSGGIDSPVAGYLMALRGMRLEAAYFHAYPYTPDEAREKVVELAGIVGGYAMGVKLHSINFTDVQIAIKDGAPEEWRTVLLRMAMMDCASRLAKNARCKCLITGESLSQVASQTIENITCTERRAALPVLRPLIGMDKEAIIAISVKIGAYPISIRPYPDCCTLFAPPHPVLHARLAEATELYESLRLDPLIDTALNNQS
ncbi:MAG: tRNA 4-thiouridine(8) synthase ThiI [Spirochaetaceae bacterium]|jgi:thiamine biosynthesis protein ThiI|nr:tRNA 4-thiouridine(8) synthase ThiI [Spirochaetaceae bacterium]